MSKYVVAVDYPLRFAQFIKDRGIKCMSPERQEMKNKTYGQIALMISNLATCKRAKVGAVLLRKNGSVAGMGYNGAPPGMRHCTDDTCNASTRCVHTAHAEENAIFFSQGEVYTAYLTHEPCLNCTRMMVRRGIREIYFLKPYTSMPPIEKQERDEILEHYGVTKTQLED